MPAHLRLAAAAAAKSLSVVVPVGPGDAAWRTLAFDLVELPDDAEVVFAATGDASPGFDAFRQRRRTADDIRWLVGARGRARQMNAGARVARGQHLWFVHADSRVSMQACAAALAFARADVDGLGHFDLAFRSDGPSVTRLNAFGANLRSRWFGLPFGDQAFLIRRALFAALGGFDENASYGEDAVFVRQARARGVPLRRIPHEVLTSARRYADEGWARVTFRHLWRTATLVTSHRTAT